MNPLLRLSRHVDASIERSMPVGNLIHEMRSATLQNITKCADAKFIPPAGERHIQAMVEKRGRYNHGYT